VNPVLELKEVPMGLQQHHGPVANRYPLNSDWLFGGAVTDPRVVNWDDSPVAAREAEPGLDDSAYEHVTIPHTVVPLSWNQWDPTSWEKVWTYRKHFDLPEGTEGRIFLDFEAANVTATVTLNGKRLGRHFGGYLPFSFEITDSARATDNVLAVLLDARFNLNVPPNIPQPVHSEAVDYWQPGGIYGTVTLRFVPSTFISDVAATPREVLDASRRRVEVTAFVDSASATGAATLESKLLDASGATVATSSVTVADVTTGTSEISLVLDGIPDIDLWDTDSPTLYRVVTSLSLAEGTTAEHTTRIGFRETRFELDGFYLNGKRLYLFGANRHQHYPFAGFAMPDRVQRKDAELLRNELNCVMVRCSHYPQYSAFLDACDELGLLVWEESAGWQYVGDAEWQGRALDDIEAMIVRDRNRPSIIIWAARLNETPDHPEFYAKTEALVKGLDDTRATSGTTFDDYHQTENYQQDVFAFDDYSIDVLPDGDHRPTLRPPRMDRPYLIGETVTSWSSPARLYRRADGAVIQQHQAMDYAYVHNIARADPRYTGVLAWSAIDYLAGHVINWRGMKTSGMLDVFRVAKPGAAMYRAQVDPAVRVVLEPAFTWDPPTERPREPGRDNWTMGNTWGPGDKAVIFSNCDRLEISVGGVHRASVSPDVENFAHLVTAPTIVDLAMEGREGADLVLEGYIGNELKIRRSYSGNRKADVLSCVPDDPQIDADGVDATRIELSIVDSFGNARGHSDARIALSVTGPGLLVGEPFFDFSLTGAVGAVWVRSRGFGEEGLITVHAKHPIFGEVAAEVRAVTP
jgi:beta-galactosidase